MNHRLARAIVTPVCAVGLVCALAPQVYAHDVVVGGNPANGETVSQFPHSITLEFSGIPQGNFNTLAVSDADSGTVLYSGQPELDKQNVTLNVPEDINPGPGSYVVGFQITSSDGHATRGKTTFTVAPQPSEQAAAGASSAPATPTTSPTAAETEAAPQAADSNKSTWLWAGVAVACALVATAALSLTKNRKG
ncbi:copper resistance CopC family protein [Corynebacterium aquilae]|uniref:CopC domain-containing protein n=1 Tax=Corynebacterium aquilae DSM 44791 TaxID=1431546 RepID=A0A1L7CGD6_9CORY|nr:copper resistance protein CopC [Corynebacterium aquilae]APT84884.1 hypothetical protein CAQU_07150 [Corynebacterium aquilae DSM 44791]